MVTKRKCAFCGADIEPGTGKMLIDASGAVAFYCSSKCEKCVELGRSARKIKWTQAYRREKAIRVQHLKETPKEAGVADKEPKKETPKEHKKQEPGHKQKKTKG